MFKFLNNIKISLCLLLAILPLSEVFSQITFDKFPEELQLFPRRADNKALVLISGTVTAQNYDKLSLQILKNGNPYQILDKDIFYENNTFTFNYAVEINAELSEYSFKLFIQKGEQASLVKQAERVVCGDVFLFYGQSNALGFPGIDALNASFSDKFLRNYDYPDFFSNDANALKWYSAQFPYARVGVGAYKLAHTISEKYRVPVAIINGAEGGQNLQQLTNRNTGNHFDTNTSFGKFLTRIKKAGAIDYAKGMVFRQGEHEAGSFFQPCNDYPNRFNTFYNQLQEDLPQLQKIYVGQNNILAEGYVERAGFLRDFQRKTQQIYPKVQAFATVGTNFYDSPHYQAEGYLQTASEVFRFISRDFYGSQDVNQITSPDIKNAFYNDKKDILTLVFEDNQQIIYPKDSIFADYTRSLKDVFFINSDNQTNDFNESDHQIESGWAEGNKVYLKLKAPSTGIYVTYLPSTFSDNFSKFYDGVHLKNARGMRAFSFYEFPISGAIINPPPPPTVVKFVCPKNICVPYSVVKK
jgi:Carbohydrate esterase, sialic acid-specific acetylesterase